MKTRTLGKVLRHILFSLLSLIVLIPFYMVFINSFKTKGEAARMNLSLPTEWIFSNYAEVIEKGKLIQGFGNSLLYAGVATLIAVVTSAMAAFVISRRKDKFSNGTYYFIICGLFLPINYITLLNVLTNMGLNGTRLGIIIVFASAIIPFCVFIIKSFMSSVPVELDEAAVIDGVGPLSLFFKIILPLLKPVLITCFLLQFVSIWSDFLTPLYLADSSTLWPMNLAVYNFFGKNYNQWNLVFADIVLTIVPVIAIYFAGQKYIISGITSGAVKE